SSAVAFPRRSRDMKRRSLLVVSAGLALAMALPMLGWADGDDNDKDKEKAPQDVVVQFGAPQPQPTPASAPHFLDPNDATVQRGGTVTFVVNGGGHGLAIYPVSRNTTREDISEDLCQGGPTVCAGGTENLRYQITDGRHHIVIDTDTNPPQPRV